MAQIKILVVDDEPDNLEYLSAILSAASYEVATAADGDAALRLMKDFTPAMVFLDVQMPRTNGFTVLKRMRETPALAAVPVVLLTGISFVTGEEYSPEKIADRYGVRPDAFLDKPIDPKNVIQQVQRLVNPAPQPST